MATTQPFDDGVSFSKRVADVLGLKFVEAVKVSAHVDDCMKAEVTVILTPEQVKKILGE